MSNRSLSRDLGCISFGTAPSPGHGIGAVPVSPVAPVVCVKVTFQASDAGGAGGAEPASQCGYVTLLGAPNAGKSTLLNSLVGEEVSIATAKRQTTWQRITGILTAGSSQLIFLDTPGIVAGDTLLDRSLLHSVREAVREADVLVLLVDPRAPLARDRRAALAEIARAASAPRIGVVNKVDAAGPPAIAAEAMWLEGEGIADVHRISARSGFGVGALLEDLARRLPPGPFLYPDDEIASAPTRFFVGEIVRQAIFDQFRDELPYASICRVEEMRDAGERSYVQVTIYVERASQKGILIGEGGKAIRRLGTAARRRVEDFVGRPVYLDLWVKVLPDWRKKPAELRRFGLPLPRERASP